MGGCSVTCFGGYETSHVGGCSVTCVASFVSKMGSQIRKKRTQNGQNVVQMGPPNTHPDPRRAQNHPKGAKRAQTGSGGRLWSILGAPPGEKPRPKWSQNGTQTGQENTSRSDRFLKTEWDVIFSVFPILWRRKWSQNGARRTPKSVQKTILPLKAAFRFDIGKQVV